MITLVFLIIAGVTIAICGTAIIAKFLHCFYSHGFYFSWL
jgi:hypothetical protein